MNPRDMNLRSQHFTEEQNTKLKGLSLLSSRVLGIALINSEQQNKQLMKAINFYAREDNYDIEEGEYYSKISLDRGDIAREVENGGTSNDN